MVSEKRTEKQRKSDGNLKGVRFIFIPRFPSFFFARSWPLSFVRVSITPLWPAPWLLGSWDPWDPLAHSFGSTFWPMCV